MKIVQPLDAEFRDNPVLFVELAHAWAAGTDQPEARHEALIKKLPRPLISKPASARDALWGVLSYPERGRSLAWLDRIGVLEELIPSWGGDAKRRAFRMKAVEEVHLERWESGISKTAFEWLCVYEDQKVDGRLGGWALTGLSTLLLTGDEPAETFAARVDHDLKTLGAKLGERERVTSAIREYPAAYEAMLTCKPAPRPVSPTAIVATICSIFAMTESDVKSRDSSVKCADKLLLRYAAPDIATTGKRH
jgi:hypothetical protein